MIFFFLPNESFLALLGGIGILLLPYRSLFYLTDACAVVGEVRFGPVDSTAAGPTATVTTGIAASAGVERSTASMGRPSCVRERGILGISAPCWAKFCLLYLC